MYGMPDEIEVTADGALRIITLNRPDALNAVNDNLHSGLASLWNQLTDDPEVQNGRKFAAKGVQIAAGVPLQVGEGEGYRSFRIGLFGLDKLYDVEGTLERVRRALDAAGL